MRKILVALLLAFATPAFAGEVLVLTTATRVDPTPRAGRTAAELQNLGPNTIYCQLRSSTGLATTKARAIQPGDAWALAVPASVQIWCMAVSANQVTGAATILTEVP